MIHMDYVWVDGLVSPLIRSKTKIINPLVSDAGEFEVSIPEWNFDGSSTRQAPGSDSECLLKPVRLYRGGHTKHIVLCEVMNPDGTPHRTNQRAKLRDTLNNTEDQK